MLLLWSDFRETSWFSLKYQFCSPGCRRSDSLWETAGNIKLQSAVLLPCWPVVTPPSSPRAPDVKSANKRVTWTWCGTNVDLGGICGLQKHYILQTGLFKSWWWHKKVKIRPVNPRCSLFVSNYMHTAAVRFNLSSPTFSRGNNCADGLLLQQEQFSVWLMKMFYSITLRSLCRRRHWLACLGRADLQYTESSESQAEILYWPPERNKSVTVDLTVETL